MRRTTTGLACFAATLLAATSAHAQGTVKIGVVMSYSGQFADPGAQIDNGIKLYMKQNGDTVAGKKLEIIRKDSGGIAPDVAKRLSQEVIVRDGATIIAGYDLTPNALAAADVSAQAKTFMVNMNAATAIITVRPANTTAEPAVPTARPTAASRVPPRFSSLRYLETMNSA